MRILHVYKDYYPPVNGGIECHLNLLANGLRDKGIDVEILVSNTSNRFERSIINGIPVSKTPQWGRFYSAPLTSSFHRYLKKIGKNADIIHFHYPNPTAEFSYLFTNLNKKLVVTYHSDIIRQDKLGKIYSPFRHLFLKKADRIIATSPNYIQSSTVLNQFKNKCAVIPLGINLDRFLDDYDLPRIDQIKKEYDGIPIILFVGCFRYYKGLHLLISAMKEVSAQLLLIGAGPEESKLRRLVKRYNLCNKITFLGQLPDNAVNIYYKACDIFVLPSHLRSEAFGLVQLEAMCCRKPVISTELKTGTSFVNVDQETGIIIKPHDISALSNSINYLIDHPEKRIQYGELGYKRVNEYFSAERMVEKTLGLYRDVIRKTKIISNISPKKPRCKSNNREKIRVMRFVSRINIGGPSIHVSTLSKYLNHRKFKTLLIAGSISPREGDMSYLLNGLSSDSTLFYHLPELQREVSPIKDLIALLKIMSIIIHDKPDIIHTHTAKAGALARISAIIINQFRHNKIKIIHTYHGHVLKGYFGNLKTNVYKHIEKSLGRWTDVIIAISQTQKWELSEKYKIAPKEKVIIINLGFDLSKFTNTGTKMGFLRKKINATANDRIIAIVGRLAPIKNHRMFLNAAKLLINKEIGDKLKFLVVGDGELRSDLEKYAMNIGIGDWVIFYGWEKNIEKIYAEIDILALTSLNEGTPVSIIEAMASSVPVITTGVGGVKDLLGIINSNEDSEGGFKKCERGILCPIHDATALANGIEYMLKNKFDRTHTTVKNARYYVLENYSYKRLVHDIESLYFKLVDQ